MFSAKKLVFNCRCPERVLVALLLLLGFLLRLTGLGSFPPGLNQDEASIGYDAWSLLTAGIDRNGAAWPVLFTSWGSGQNVLYAYLSLPFLAIFGLSPLSLRLCAGFWGSISLLFFWHLARKQGGSGFGLTALAVLALNPWHLLLSRWALESNLLPAFLLLGLWLLSRTEEQPRLLPAAAAVFALSLYAYGTAFLYLPFFLLFASIHLLRRRRVTPGNWLLSLGLFLLLALPLGVCQLRNALGLPGLRIGCFTLPALTETRQSSTVSCSLRNLAALLRLLWTQRDGLVWNSAGPFGLFYGKAGLLFVLLGLWNTIRQLRRRELPDGEIYLLLALLASLPAACFIQVNINRVNFFFLPLLWLQAKGLWLLMDLWRPLRYALPALLLAAALGLGHYYVTDYAAALGPAFHEGLPEAIAYADGLDAERVWISGSVNQPYIYVLFVTQTPATDFLETVNYWDPDAPFRHVLEFGRYRFYGSPPEGLCILPIGEADGEILRVFGGYAVVLRQPL